MTEEKKEVIDIRDIVPRGYVIIPTDLYTKMVETAARYDMMEEQIPEEWCKGIMDIFLSGMDAVSYERKQLAEFEESKKKAEEEMKRKRAEEKEKAKHRCPDPGKLNSLMGAGWSADDIGSEFGVPTAEVYEWLSQLCRGEYDAVLKGMEVR